MPFRKLIPFFALLLTSCSLFCQDLILNFDLNQTRPVNESIKLLSNNFSSLNSCDSILLVGHTDTTGSNSYNEQLSKSRVFWVKNYLRNNGVNVISHTDWKGETQVMDSENDSLNRRVMLYAFHTKKELPEKITQEFIIDNTKDTMLFGSENTVIIIPAHSIECNSTNGSAKYNISLREYYTLTDILFNKLTTQTPNDLLATEGMIYLEITQKGIPCTINPDNPVSIGFQLPTDSNPELKLYSGQANENNEIIWDNSSLPTYKYGVLLEPLDEDLLIDSEKYSLPEGSELATFFGKDKEEFKNYILERIDRKELGIDSSDISNIKIKIHIDPLGNIIDQLTQVTCMSDVLRNELLEIINNAPEWEPAKIGRIRVKSIIQLNIGVPEEYASSEYYNENNNTSFSTRVLRDKYYRIFRTSKLQWINCDFYPFSGTPRVEFIIETDGIGTIQCMLVFEKYKSVMRPEFSLRDNDNSKTYYKFPSIPINEPVRAILIKNIGDDIFIGTSSANTKQGKTIVTTFESISIDKLREKIVSLSTSF